MSSCGRETSCKPMAIAPLLTSWSKPCPPLSIATPSTLMPMLRLHSPRVVSHTVRYPLSSVVAQVVSRGLVERSRCLWRLGKRANAIRVRDHFVRDGSRRRAMVSILLPRDRSDVCAWHGRPSVSDGLAIGHHNTRRDRSNSPSAPRGALGTRSYRRVMTSAPYSTLAVYREPRVARQGAWRQDIRWKISGATAEIVPSSERQYVG